MGANFQTLSLPGNITEADVRVAFYKVQDEDRYENGHSYSGGFGMAQGLDFAKESTFPNRQAADQWLEEHAQKWEAAVAVRFAEPDGSERWRIGAWCAS